MSTIAPAAPPTKEMETTTSLASAPEGEAFAGEDHLEGLGAPITIKKIDRFLTATITVLPVLLLGFAVWQTWNRELHWRDVLIFAVMYVPCGLGVTVGFHRLLTHRSFKTARWLRALFAICGTMAIEGPVIDWVTFHRQHHAYSDRPGDPHSPHVGHGEGLRGALSGLVHAHLGWLFEQVQRGSTERYAPDLLADPAISFIDRTFIFWSLLGLAIPFGLGVLLGGTLKAGLWGLVWGGAVRMFVLHHVTYSINSLCHFFGRRRFATDDESRNLLWLAPLSFGESWHNNHHAFPTSAFHGMRAYELDISGLLIATLERLGLAWDVQRIGTERQAAKAIA